MNKPTIREVFSIPNIMGYFRILLIPVFCYIYITAETTREYYTAVILVIISSLTDLFDGKIARRFNMVTELGKVVDPVADNLTHAALAICIATKYRLMWALLVLMAVKETYMAVMGLIYLKKGTMMDGAMWYGKVCTSVLFTGLAVLFVFPNMNPSLANALIVLMMVVMAVTLIMYISYYSGIKKEHKVND